MEFIRCWNKLKTISPLLDWVHKILNGSMDNEPHSFKVLDPEKMKQGVWKTETSDSCFGINSWSITSSTCWSMNSGEERTQKPGKSYPVISLWWWCYTILYYCTPNNIKPNANSSLIFALRHKPAPGSFSFNGAPWEQRITSHYLFSWCCFP